MSEKEVLELILSKISNMEKEIQNITIGQNELKDQLITLELKTDVIYNQTANLTEFKTENIIKLDKIVDDIEFLKHEEYEHKQDLFKLKKNMKVLK